MVKVKFIAAFGALSFLAVIAAIALAAKPMSSGEPAKGIPIFAPNGTALPDGHVVLGETAVPAGRGAIVTLSGPAAFKNVSSYACYGDYPGPIGGLQKVDGRQIIVPRISDTPIIVRFMCIGS
ncbi:MAG: hypothetical protein ACR2IF_03630 [Terriglobales bacterium]